MKSSTQVVQNLIKPYIDRNAANIAPVETSATAAAAHAAGTQIVYKGVLYDVTADIAQGDTITVGTNITAADPLSSEIQTLSNVRAELGAHNLFDGLFKNGLLMVGENYTNKVIDRTEALPNSTVAVSKYFMFGAYLPAGSYVISVNGSDYVSFNRVAIAGTNCVGSSTHLRPSYSFTSAVDGWNYFSIERDAGESDYSDIDFEGHDLKIMITLASDSDPTYQPYAKPNTELTKDDSGLTANAFTNGTVNLLENTKTSMVNEGITYTVNDDKTILVNAGGQTGGGGSVFAIKGSSDAWKLPVGSYKLTGSPNSINANLSRIIMRVHYGSGYIEYRDTGDGFRFEITNSIYNDSNYKVIVYIEVAANITLPSNVLFKPMITVADMPNSDYAHYVPYAKSNKELTEDVEDLSNAQYFDFTTETSVQANTSAQPMTYTIANDGTYRVSLTSKDVDAQNGATLLINGITIGTVRADIIENNVSRILKLKKGAVITNTNSGTARYRMDVIKLSYI